MSFFLQIGTFHEIPNIKILVTQSPLPTSGVDFGKAEFAVQIWTYHSIPSKIISLNWPPCLHPSVASTL